MKNETAVTLQRGFILHARKYRDTSVLVDVFTRREGRFSAVARGARGKHGGRFQPFTPLLMSFYGRGELRTAGKVEPDGRPYQLQARNLLIGLYVNELLYRLMGRFDPMELLFDRYEALIAQLQETQFSLLSLREFELLLLSELGYGISFDVDVQSGAPVDETRHYGFVADEGFSVLDEAAQQPGYEGRHLLAIAEGRMDEAAEKVARQIIRRSIDRLLGGKVLHSRALFSGRPS